MTAVRPIRDADRVYRHTRQHNVPARPLHDAVGHATSLVVYER